MSLANAPTIPQAGQKAPPFSLVDASGRTHHLSDFLGKRVVLYFYPKDDTSGCTKEACDFRDNNPLFQKKNAVIIGISKDPPASHAKFTARYGLPFLLLCDPQKEALARYGAFKEKFLFGKRFWGIRRSTFVIDERGVIAAAYPDVKVEGHAAEILSRL